MNSARHFILLFFLPVVLLVSCEKNRTFDKNISIEKSGWEYGDAKKFTVNILDTASAYNLFINVRHTDEYPYSNLWIKMTTTHPDSIQENTRLNVPLAEASGKWTGNCVDGICYNSVLMNPGIHFPHSGTYIFSIEQDMRMNPLPYVMDVGLKVEKE